MIRARTHETRRAAFTLVELLVVIAIIAIMLALSGVAYFRFTSSQMISNTQAKIEAIDKAFQVHWSAVVNEAKNESPSATALKLAGGDIARAQVIWIKARLAEAFPMSFAEINSPLVYAPNLTGIGDPPLIPFDRHKYNTAYFKKLNGIVVPKLSESAACLRIVLSVAHAGTKPAEGLDRHALDTDGDGLEEFVDDWRQPLQFFRFPTDHAVLQSSAPSVVGPASKLRDPLDPQGTLVNPTWYASAWRPIYESTVLHKIYDSGAPPRVNYTIPVIASGGGNNQLGISALYMGITNGAQEADNIYSFKLQVGGGTKS